MNSDYVQRVSGEPQPIIKPEVVKSESDRAHLFTAGAGIWLPMLQALASGFVLAMLVWWIAWQFLHASQPWRWALGAFVITWTSSWFLLLASWRYLVRPLELFFHQDINNDNKIGDYTDDEIPVITAVVWNEEGTAADRDRIPCPLSKLQTLARGILIDKRPFSEAEWCGAGKPFSERQFRAVRDKFILHGWAVWVNPEHHKQGIALTKEGYALMYVSIENELSEDD